MKPILHGPTRLPACLLAALIAHSASAASLYWSGNGTTQGGAGTWDTTPNHWGTASSGPYPSAWNNSNNDTAIFAGTAGTATLGADVIVGGLQFNTTGYIVDPGTGPFKLTFGTAGSANVSTGTSTVNAVVAGSSTITKTGSGTLLLGATNTFTGNTAISGGTLQIGNNSTAATLGPAAYSGNISIASGAKLLFNNSTSQTLSGVISGEGDLQKAGGASLTLSGANTYTGKTLIAATGQGGPTLSVSSLNSVNGGTPLFPSSSLGTPNTVANGTIQLGNGGNQRGCALTYTGPGETTDRVINVQFNSGSGHTITASGTGLLRFTSPFTITPSSGSTGSSLTLRGAGSGEIARIETIPGIITKNDAGTWTILEAVNTTPSAAPINVTAGTLVFRKGGFGQTGTTTVSANAALVYHASTDTPFYIAGPLAITGGASTTIGATIGSTVDSARIQSAGNATTTAAAVKLNLYGSSFSTIGDGSDAYTLIQGGGTNTLHNATWSLGTVFNATRFTVGAITKSPDAIRVDLTQVPMLASAYWKGTATSNITKQWAASNGSTESNWSTTPGGLVQSLVPGADTDVIISSTPPAVAPVNTTLGADMSIRSLTIADTTTGLGLDTSVKDSYGLTIGTGGITMNSGVPASTIGTPIVLGGSQTWTNDSANTLTVSGAIRGSGDLEKAGGGTVNLTGLNTFDGDVTVTAGTLAFAKPTVPADAMVRVAAGATLQLDYPGNILVSYLILDGVSRPAGTYNNSNAAPFLTGTGSLTVTTTDTDVDGIPDSWMITYFGHPTGEAADNSRAQDDADNDGLTNLREFQEGTDPKDSDSDNDNLTDGAEVNTHASKPLLADTDGDTLNDGAEVNTHGTNLLLADTDADGLKDGVEINTHTTNPLLKDSDTDGAGDWYELFASFTDPKVSTSKPNIPYPLPKPDNTPPAANKPVKVFILMGQSNMQGKGAINPILTPGTLATVVKDQNKFPNLLDANGNWSARGDVKYRGVISCIGNADLTVGQGTGATQIGPELGFGHVMGYHFDEPVIVIKASFGGQSLGFDFLPPGSQRYTTGGYTYAGYLDTVWRWNEGATPPPQHVPGTPISYLANPVGGAQNYAGKMFDDCVAQVNGILNNFANQYPQYAAQGYQIAGIGWFQGWNDSVTTTFPERYESNMANFITAYRSAVNAPNAPFVIAACGFGGWAASGGQLAVINAQLAVANRPGFAGNVKTMETRGYWREPADSPISQGYHYNQNSETYLLTGDAMARGMIDLLPSGNASAYATWAAVNAPSGDPDDDFDGDGVSNALEFVLGGLATTNDLGKLPVAATSGTNMTFSFVRKQSSIDPATSVTIEVGTTLATWPDSYSVPDGPTAGPPVAVVDNLNGTDSVTLTLPQSPDARKFARLKVVITP
jgi:autotransporter-associated beta strand protein